LTVLAVRLTVANASIGVIAPDPYGEVVIHNLSYVGFASPESNGWRSFGPEILGAEVATDGSAGPGDGWLRHRQPGARARGVDRARPRRGARLLPRDLGVPVVGLGRDLHEPAVPALPRVASAPPQRRARLRAGHGRVPSPDAGGARSRRRRPGLRPGARARPPVGDGSRSAHERPDDVVLRADTVGVRARGRHGRRPDR